MKRPQVRLAIALLFGGLFILTFLGTLAATDQINMLYRDAAGLTTVHSIAQTGVVLAGILWIIAALMVAVQTAFQAGGRIYRLLYVLPVYLLALTVLVIIAALLLQIGVTGTAFATRIVQFTLSG